MYREEPGSSRIFPVQVAYTRTLRNMPDPNRPPIVFDASPAVHNKAGLTRYAEELLGALVFDQPGATAAGSGITVLYHDAAAAKPSPLVKSLKQIAIHQTPYPWRLRALLAQLLNIAQDSLLTPALPASGAAPVFHATEHLLPRLKRSPAVFTLHDLIFKHLPQYHLPRNRIFLNLAMPLFLKRAAHVICVSEHTKRDAIAQYGLSEAKISVVPEAVHPRFKRVIDVPALQAARDAHALPERFVLSLGTIEPRKNYPTLIKAFAEYCRAHNDSETQLIIIGRPGWLFEETYRTVHEQGMTGRVRFLGFIDDASLPAIYSLARVFALPSIYEGFGFTPLEALSCGAAVLCSNAASLPEVIGDAGVLLPPNDIAAWSQALGRALTDDDFRRDLMRRGPAQAARFSWARAAQDTRAIYARVYSA
jgi:glycosyltransferase involved in cell wall biosynthesis